MHIYIYIIYIYTHIVYKEREGNREIEIKWTGGVHYGLETIHPLLSIYLSPLLANKQTNNETKTRHEKENPKKLLIPTVKPTRRSFSSPPLNQPEEASPPHSSSSTVLNRETVSLSNLFEDLKISSTDPLNNPRSFPYSVKQKCWEKAEKVKGRDPERWRRDLLGNTVFRKLVGCPGCLCHDYDHIVPFSKGGKSTLENCQVLQATVNQSKGNRTDISRSDLIQKSSYCRVSGRDMDLLELSAYGNVRRGQDSGGCNIQ